MAILSMFYGIVVRIYFFDDKRHHVAHVHAEYSGNQAVFAIADGEVLAANRCAWLTLTLELEHIKAAWAAMNYFGRKVMPPPSNGRC